MCNWDDRWDDYTPDPAEEAAHLAKCDGTTRWPTISGKCEHIAHFRGDGKWRETQ